MVILDRDVQLSNKTGFICLDKNTNTNPGTYVYAVGWGYTNYKIQQGYNKLIMTNIYLVFSNDLTLNTRW